MITETCLIVIVIFVIYTLTCDEKYKEQLTRIRRGVGFANDADETPVAAGVIHSAPVLDYTHTYFDGKSIASCDQCANGVVCPLCPQYLDNAKISTAYDYVNTKENPKENLIAWDANATQIADYTTDTCNMLHDLDTDAEFTTSREYRGACSSRNRLHARSEIRGDLLNITDTTFDRAGEHAVKNTRQKCKNTKSALSSSGDPRSLLAAETRGIYMDRFGLGPLSLSPVDYTYLGYNDRVYKDSINLQY